MNEGTKERRNEGTGDVERGAANGRIRERKGLEHLDMEQQHTAALHIIHHSCLLPRSLLPTFPRSLLPPFLRSLVPS
jgi:hypothetical protein